MQKIIREFVNIICILLIHFYYTFKTLRKLKQL
jgi:hypothetical protein